MIPDTRDTRGRSIPMDDDNFLSNDGLNRYIIVAVENVLDKRRLEQQAYRDGGVLLSQLAQISDILQNVTSLENLANALKPTQPGHSCASDVHSVQHLFCSVIREAQMAVRHRGLLKCAPFRRDRREIAEFLRLNVGCV